MEVEYVLASRDLVAFYEFDFRREPFPWRILALFPAMAAFLVGISWVKGDRTAALSFGILSLLLAGVLFLLGPGIRRWSRLTALKRDISGGQYVAALSRRKVSLSAAGITEETEARVVKTSWQAVTEIATTQDHVFFYTGHAAAAIIPRAAFAERGGFENFVQVALDYRADNTSEARG